MCAPSQTNPQHHILDSVLTADFSSSAVSKKVLDVPRMATYPLKQYDI